MSEITITNAVEMKKGMATPFGGGAHVIIPKTWIGHNVNIVRIEDKYGDRND